MARIETWGDMAAPELSEYAKNNAVALLPIAAMEQHGPHLPLATDVIIGDGIVRAATKELVRRKQDVDVLLLPTLTMGCSLEHTHFPGTLSLSTEQMMAQLRATGHGVARSDIRRLIIFNSHGGNKAAVDAAALQLRAEHALLVVKANYFRFPLPSAALNSDEVRHGLHGGALETSMMLHLAPRKVRREAIAHFESLGERMARSGFDLGPEGDAGFAWMAEDLHPQGVTGNACLADAETGARLIKSFADRLARIITETAAFDLNALRRAE